MTACTLIKVIPYDHQAKGFHGSRLAHPSQDLEGAKATSGDTRGGQKSMGLTGPLKEGLLGYTNHKGISGTPGEARCKAFKVPNRTWPE